MNFSNRIQFWCHTVFENKPKNSHFVTQELIFKFKSTFYASVILSIFGAKIQIFDKVKNETVL